MGLADFALTPVKPIPTKQYCTPIKDGEYWALGLPVVIPRNISDDSDIIQKNDIGAVLESLNAESYKKAVLKIDSLIKQPRKQNFDKIRSIAQRYRSFEIAEMVYKNLYNSD
jgi:glycosyltransferase involved in cell wall biosynthesis